MAGILSGHLGNSYLAKDFQPGRFQRTRVDNSTKGSLLVYLAYVFLLGIFPFFRRGGGGVGRDKGLKNT